MTLEFKSLLQSASTKRKWKRMMGGLLVGNDESCRELVE